MVRKRSGDKEEPSKLDQLAWWLAERRAKRAGMDRRTLQAELFERLYKRLVLDFVGLLVAVVLIGARYYLAGNLWDLSVVAAGYIAYDKVVGFVEFAESSKLAERIAMKGR